MAVYAKVAPFVGVAKVGLSLFVEHGPAAVRAFQKEGAKVFLDLKLHDIPNTVELAAARAAELGEAVRGGEHYRVLFALGLLLFFLTFLVRELFIVKRGADSSLVELKPADQPTLFAFLYKLADETGAPRPHKVFLSGRVNAGVFYDLSRTHDH